MKNLTVFGAKTFMHNFDGRKFGDGKKSFSLIIDDPDMADELNNQGYNVKIFTPEKGEPVTYIPVAMRFDLYPPLIVLISNGVKTKLDEEDVERTLPRARIENIDLEINPSRWEKNGKTGVKCYLSQMFVTVEDNELAAKYGYDF